MMQGDPIFDPQSAMRVSELRGLGEPLASASDK
jgi:hypothetical protein